MVNEINILFGVNLLKFREARHMTQEEFAYLCGISRAYYGRIERGEHSATIELCDKIATALGIHISALFEDLPY